MAANLSQPNRTQASMVELVALVVVIVIAGWFFVRPQYAALSSRKAQLTQAQTDYQNVDQDKNDLAALSAKIKGSQADLALVDQALPLQDRPTQVEVLLDGLVSASGMKLMDLNFQPSSSDNVVAGNRAELAKPYGVERKLVATSYDLNVSGSVDQFKNLLQLIETNSRIVDVTTLDMTNGQGSAVFKLKLKAYSYVP